MSAIDCKRNISPLNVFGFHDVIFGSSHLPWSKGEVLLTALEPMWHHRGQRSKHQLQEIISRLFKQIGLTDPQVRAFGWYVTSLSLVMFGSSIKYEFPKGAARFDNQDGFKYIVRIFNFVLYYKKKNCYKWKFCHCSHYFSISSCKDTLNFEKIRGSL